VLLGLSVVFFFEQNTAYEIRVSLVGSEMCIRDRSNIGSKLVLRGGRMGFGEQAADRSFHRLEEEITGELRRTFSPEFINRVDEVIVFNPLGKPELRGIIDILLNDVNQTVAERNLKVEVTDDAKEWLLDRAGIDPSTGARPLRRTIQRHVQDAVSELLIARHGEKVETIVVECKDGELHLEVAGLEVAAAEV